MTAIVGSLRRIDSNVWFSPYGFPVHPFYMCDDPIWKLYAGNMPSPMNAGLLAVSGSPEIHESDFKTGIYLKITGELELKGGILIDHVFHVENIDAQIKASIADWRHACAEWQDREIQKTEGESKYWSEMERLPRSDAHILGFGKECGIQFILTIPNGSVHGVTLMRPAN